MRRGLLVLGVVVWVGLMMHAVSAGGGHGSDEEEHHEEGDDPCAREELVNYDLALHIGSVFILLGVSLLGSLLPVILSLASVRKFPTVQVAIRLGSYFGFGTMLATGLIHMLLPAHENLTNKCVGSFWSEQYEAWAYVFTIVAILFMQLMDYLIEVVTKVDSDEARKVYDQPIGCSKHAHCDEETDSHQNLLQLKMDQSTNWSMILLEAGIAFHSVLIGVTLGVTAGSSFTTLLIALSFHQFFEGFAIVSAAVNAGFNTKKSFVMALAYSVTTPVGIAIGIGIRSSYNGNSQEALLVQGIFDALSAGILLYVVLVELVSPMMTHSKWLRTASPLVQVLSFASFYAGAAALAVVGKWA